MSTVSIPLDQVGILSGEYHKMMESDVPAKTRRARFNSLARGLQGIGFVPKSANIVSICTGMADSGTHIFVVEYYDVSNVVPGVTLDDL